MTTPDRTIGGLPPRRKADPKNLISANRAAVARPAVDAAGTDVDTPQTSAVGEQATVSTVPAPVPQQTPAAQAPSETNQQGNGGATKDKLSVYVSKDLRAALRAAYRATGHLEGDDSFSALVERALQAELTRRQQTYNDGHPFATSSGRLPSGRPLAT